MKNILQEILFAFHSSPLPAVLSRDVEIPFQSKKIITLIGPRRSGKSYLLYHLIQSLLKKGVDKRKIVYLNFEDERLSLRTEQLDLILQAYRELYPDNDLSQCYFFFDEIQNVTGWERFVRRVNDTYTANIFITGSNSNLLSTEIATSLRGRTLTFPVYPLSLSEYLRFSNINATLKTPTAKARISSALKRYLTDGGFPETLTVAPVLKIKLLQEYFDVMIYRDLVQRYQFTNITVVKYFLKRCASCICSPVSLHKFYNEIRSLGYKLDKNFLYEVHEASNHIFLVFNCHKFSYSALKRENSAKKIFIIDTGLLNAITVKFDKDYGHLLENMVHLELLRRNFNVFYYREKAECDFIVQRTDEEPTAIQVCYSLGDPDTYKREMKGLTEACHTLKIRKGIVFTMDSGVDESKKFGKINVRALSVTQFLLDKEMYMK